MTPPLPHSTDNEIFDVVNDRDEVIGQNTRGEVHRLDLNHRAVHVLVFNACSARLRSVMSSLTATKCVTRPASSRIGEIEACSQ